MLTLRLLGGLALDNPQRVRLGRAAQRRRLALLAVLASPAGTSIAREKLLGLLWPEVPPDDARHRLSVALYDLRRALGDDAIAIHAHAVTLAPGALHIDVASFDAAMARADWETAVALYAGPFLDGVYLLDAANFEQWVDERRAELERAAARALEMVAGERARRGDPAGALDAWRRLTRIDPYSGRFATGLMRALDAAGDRAGALRHAAAHSELLRTELDSEPAADVEQLATELKRAASLPDTAQAATTFAEAPRAAALVEPAAFVDVVTDPVVAPRRSALRTPAMVFALLVMLTAALRILPSRPQQQVAAQDGGDISSRALSGMQVGGEHVKAGRFDDAVATFARVAAEDSTFALAHLQLALATLWADQPGSNPDVQVERALAHRDRLDELNRTLLEGLVAWRRGEWNRAEALYRRALAIDAGSIDARHQLGETLFHYNTPQGRPTGEARAEFERVLELEPRHYGALWHLALLASRDGRTAEVDTLTSRLLALQPDAVRRLDVEVLRAVALNDDVAFARLLDRLRGADESLLFGTGWRLAVFARQLDAAERVLTLLTDSSRGPYARGHGHVQLLILDIARGRNDAATARLRALMDVRDPGVDVVWPRLLLAIAPGMPLQTDVLRVLRDSLAAAQVEDPLKADHVAQRALEHLVAAAWIDAILGDSIAALAVATRLEQYANAARGEATDNAAWAVGRAASIRALQADHAGRPDDVIRWIDRSLSYRWFGDALVQFTSTYSMERYLRAEALLTLGRRDEADAWLATIGEHDPFDLVFLAPALQRRADIAEMRGDTTAARHLRSRFDVLRHKAGSE